MFTLIYVISCLIALLMLGIVIAGIVMVMKAAQRDSVSAAREDWIQRRSDKDEQEW